MTARRPGGRLLAAVLVLVSALTIVVLGTEQPAAPRLEPAALAGFEAGNIIADRVFYDSDAMSADQIKAFLAAKGANCRPVSGGPACIKDLVLSTSSRAADPYCNRYQGARESAAAMIGKVGVACGINPRVLMVMLEKEQGIIRQSTPSSHKYSRAMGFGCPDSANGGCDALYYGLFNQVYSAARQFKVYAGNPTRYSHRAGVVNRVLYHPRTSCGAPAVLIENQATASLYNYTPYQPNAAALRAGTGEGDSCSSYGNRNFYNWFTDWFGSTQGDGRDVDAPLGRLEAVLNRGQSVLVRGWAYDPDSPKTAVRLGIVVDGRKVGSSTTDVARADVAAANYGVGPSQGFEETVPLAVGKHTVCVYAANIGEGYTTPRLGCATVSVTYKSSFNPKGRLVEARTAGTRLVVEGWSFDPDSPKSASTVRVFAGTMRLGDVVAKDTWADVAKYYPSAGPAHGFRLDTRLPKGTHKICAYGLNRGIGTASPSLGCTTVTITANPVSPPVTSGSPVGKLESFVLDGQDLSIKGWAFDPDQPTRAARVQVLANGRLISEPVSTGDRPDVQKKHPYAGSPHGFAWKGIVPAGTYPLCVRVVNAGDGVSRAFTCLTRSVVGDPGSNPIGGPRIAEVTGSTVRFAGWSYDPDLPTEPVTVRVYEGSTTLATIAADDLWPDVGKYHPAAGSLHGFEWTGTLPPGSHSICVQVTNLRYGTGDPRLGCKTVNVVGGAAEGSRSSGPTSSAPATTSEAPASSSGSDGATDPATGTATDTATTTSEAPATSAAPSS